MLRLYEATGENVHLAVLDAPTPETPTALYVGRLTGPRSIPTLSRMGGRHPLHTTGVGKALLAARDELWLERYFAQPLERETTHSITSEQELRDDLDRARARGYATTHEEMTLGNVSVAAALGPVDGLPPVALGVVVHLDRADERRLGPLRGAGGPRAPLRPRRFRFPLSGNGGREAASAVPRLSGSQFVAVEGDPWPMTDPDPARRGGVLVLRRARADRRRARVAARLARHADAAPDHRRDRRAARRRRGPRSPPARTCRRRCTTSRRIAPASCVTRPRTRGWSIPRRSSCGRRRSDSATSPPSSPISPCSTRASRRASASR